MIRFLKNNIDKLLGFENCNIFLQDTQLNCLYGVSVEKQADVETEQEFTFDEN